MSDAVERYFEVALEIVRDAGKLIKDAIKKKKTVQTKSGETDFVTETDQAVEKYIISNILKNFPDHKFIGEESTADGKPVELKECPTWIVDPIDGTMNFVHTNPNCCISLGLAINREIEAGIIYNPVLNLMFTAKNGKGAYLNGERIHVSGQTELSRSIVMMETGTGKDPEKLKCVTHNFHTLLPKVHGIRSWGSAAMDIAAVSAGWVDVYFEFGIHCWDMAAGAAIAKEAGAVIVNTDGGPLDLMARRVLVAGSQQLATALSQGLYQFSAPRD